MTKWQLVMVTAVLVAACAPRGLTVPPPLPATTTDSGARSNLQVLVFVPGRFQYQLVQSTQIKADNATDTIANLITVTAQLTIDVAPPIDSSYEVAVSVDSVQTSAQGAIPHSPVAQPVSLGRVLQANISPHQTTVTSQLPDSLCAYSQFVTAAREAVLPQLPSLTGLSGNSVQTDTAVTIACRAGSRIEVVTTRELRDLSLQGRIVTARIQGRAELKGSGTLGRDSLEVSGRIRTSGTASFVGGSRLPSVVKTESDGVISVTLNDSTTVFRQTSVQEIRQKAPPPPN